MSNIAKHANKLIHEKSPYLLQHAFNPVIGIPKHLIKQLEKIGQSTLVSAIPHANDGNLITVITKDNSSYHLMFFVYSKRTLSPL